jgi:flagellar protein FlaJ
LSNVFSLRKIKERLSGLFSGGSSGEIERELPFAVMIFTLMAASGTTLYEGWKKICSIDLLPVFQREAKDLVRKVEISGYDPITVMYKKAEETKSKPYRDFLAGYVSAVKSGGSVVSFLKSKLRSIFEVRNAAAVRSVENLGTLVETYTVMLIVTLCVYILLVMMPSASLLELSVMGWASSVSQPILYLLIFFVTPLLSVLLMFIAHITRRSNLMNIKQVYYKAALPTIGTLSFFLLMTFVPQLKFITEIIGFPSLVLICLVIVALPPSISYYKIAKTNFSAEEGMPSFLIDVTEARKTGLSSEKSIVHASKRKGYGEFSEVLRLIRNQISWGVPLKKIFRNIREKIQSWPVLVNFLVLVETIRIGGGSANALEILSEYSEKEKNIEKNKRDMLKPYIVLSFVWSVLIALTTIIVLMSLYILAQLTALGFTETTYGAVQQLIEVFSAGIIFECWLSGFFIGKVSEGSFVAGFKYSAMLAVTAYISLLLSENFLWILRGVIPS